MYLFNQPIRTTINAILLAAALVSIGLVEVKANRFDKGFLPPSAKARRFTAVGTVNHQAPKVRVAVGDVNGDNLTNTTRRNRMRPFTNQRRIAGSNRKSFILPYIEHSNIYR